MRFGMGTMNNGERALRTPQSHSDGAGVTSDYLPRLNSHGRVVRGSTVENAIGIFNMGWPALGGYIFIWAGW